MILFALAAGAFHFQPAQSQESEGPIYIVQEGDSLWDIAARFRVSMAGPCKRKRHQRSRTADRRSAAGHPWASGRAGILTTREIQLGESLRGISRRYRIPEDVLIRLNHLTSPEELFAGATLVLPEQNAAGGGTVRSVVEPGQSLLELAIANGSNPWTDAAANQLPGAWAAIPGDVLHFSGSSGF